MTISPLADVSPHAVLGSNVSIGPFTVVHSNTVLGDNVTIQSHCALGVPAASSNGEPLRIGDNSLVRSHSVFYEASAFGPNLHTGHHVTVREHVTAGANLQLGTLADLQGETTIGDYVRIFNAAHITQFSAIGSFVWIFPYVVFTNDPLPPSAGPYVGVTVGDFAVIATNVTVLPGTVIGADALVGASSLVSRNVDPGDFVSGIPAKKLGRASQLVKRDGTSAAYPWRRHFHRGFPPEIVESWIVEFQD